MGRPADHVKNLPSEGLFSSFMSDAVIDEHIVIPTNRKIEVERLPIGESTGKSIYKNTTLLEIKCLIGFLVMSGSRKDCSFNTDEIFNPTYGCQFYNYLFSQKIFEFLIRCMRFDDATTWDQRSNNDRFFLFREL